MKIRSKFTLTFLVLALVPLIVIGAISFKSEEDIIRRTLGTCFNQRAHEVINKVDSVIYGIYGNVQAWVEPELMQEVITDDLDGTISSFLIGLNKKHHYFSSIDVLNSDGMVVASSDPKLIGENLSHADYYTGALNGSVYVKDVYPDQFSKHWVVVFSSCIKAMFDRNKTIGVLCARWKANDLFNVIRYQNMDLNDPNQLHNYSHMNSHIVLLRGDGLLLSGLDAGDDEVFNRNLVKEGLRSATMASKKTGGYSVEEDRGEEYIIGYDYSTGYRNFSGLGWSALVLQSTKIAFAPIQRIKIIIFYLGVIVALIVVVIAVILSRKMSNPILKISDAAGKVANGDFNENIDISSNDEIDELANIFNKMITDLRAQRAMLVDKDYVDNIFRSMIEALIVVTPEGRIKMVNQAALELLGYAEDELINNDINMILAGETLISEIDKNNFVKGVERVYIGKNGRKIPVLFSSSLMCNQKGLFQELVCVAQDISERKRIEDAIKENMLKYQSLMRLANDSIFTVDVETSVIIDVNYKTEKLLNVSASEIIGKRHTELFPNEVLDNYSLFFKKVLCDGTGVLGVSENISVVRRDGQRIPVEISASVINVNGQLIVQQILKDLTVRKKMENELSITRMKIEKKILEVEEKERNRIGRDLHDSIGQLLTGIFLKIQIMQRELDKKGLEYEVGQAEEIVSLVNNSIKQTRMLAKGLAPLGEEENSLSKMLEELIYNVKNVYGISCTFTYDHGIQLKSFSLVTNLFRIAQEAINNAIKHASAKNIDIIISSENDLSKLEIKDDGTGITDEQIQKDGMGLHTMQYRANIIGALLDIERRENGGTVVRCTFKAKSD